MRIEKIVFGLCWALFIAGLFGCATNRKLPRRTHQELDKLVQLDSEFSKSFTGFMLYDPMTRDTLYQSNANKYFTPASNTKIVTLYTSLQLLGSGIPLWDIVETSDTVYVRGLGSPTTLHPKLPGSDGEIRRLAQKQKPLVLYLDKSIPRYGPGWSWDDYNYGYQSERSSLPLYGNTLWISGEPNTFLYNVDPNYFEKHIYRNSDLQLRPFISRDEDSNIWHLAYARFDSSGYERALPFITKAETVSCLLSEFLEVPVVSRTTPWPFENAQRWYELSTPIDSVYARLMQISDNFIAEQLLISCAAARLDSALDPDPLIEYAIDSILSFLVDPPQWVDGSGLSRYNAFTPRTMVQLLERLYNQKPWPWIQKVFPAGGVNGTIRNYYPGNHDQPFVWAKTGTLRHKHCLSGFVQTQSGRILIFSFMHNQFMNGSYPIKQSMTKVLNYLYRHL